MATLPIEAALPASLPVARKYSVADVSDVGALLSDAVPRERDIHASRQSRFRDHWPRLQFRAYADCSSELTWFSLLYSVFRLMPSSSAARGLLPL